LLFSKAGGQVFQECHESNQVEHGSAEVKWPHRAILDSSDILYLIFVFFIGIIHIFGPSNRHAGRASAKSMARSEYLSVFIVIFTLKI